MSQVIPALALQSDTVPPISAYMSDDLLVSGFGKFSVNEKAGRKGRNPATGEDLMLRPRRVVKFKCSGKLREKINGG